MAKVIIKDLSKSPAAVGRRVLREKRVINGEGKIVKIPTIDSNSPHFSADLLQLFRKNVAKARRENKQWFGSPDRVGQKT